jgi:hypothetical protein
MSGDLATRFFEMLHVLLSVGNRHRTMAVDEVYVLEQQGRPKHSIPQGDVAYSRVAHLLWPVDDCVFDVWEVHHAK